MMLVFEGFLGLRVLEWESTSVQGLKFLVKLLVTGCWLLLLQVYFVDA